ncbi:WecB/TagA/CpsF family glycosyltransferase [Zhongshania sp.]|uniref:WecB/TagA/CpsF family glycosyltransferase n=1 Tax=Zhongshania sp. TaxID=1971902 RepID=UPI00356B1FC7
MSQYQILEAKTLHKRSKIHRAPLLWNILRGDIRLVGTRLLRIDDAIAADQEKSQFAVKPGLFSLFELRRISGLEFIDEKTCNTEFAQNGGLKQRVAIVIKSLLAGMLYGNTKDLRNTPTFKVFGVEINNVTMNDALATIADSITKRAQKTVFFANAHTLNLAYENANFRELLNKVDYLLPDGSGIEVACRHAGIRRKGNINGTDMLPLLCEQLAASGKSIYMLGGEEGIAKSAMANMKKRYPALRVAGTKNGFFDKNSCADVVADINQSQADIVLVGMGQPLQEQWVAEYRDQLETPVVMAVGGLFDFYAEKVSRAPLWLRELGMEWTWRLIQEPGRMWKRYIIGNPLFLIRLRRST